MPRPQDIHWSPLRIERADAGTGNRAGNGFAGHYITVNYGFAIGI